MNERVTVIEGDRVIIWLARGFRWGIVWTMNGVLKFLQSRASISSRFSLVHRDFQNNVDPIKHVFQYRNVSSSFARRKLKFKNLSSILWNPDGKYF